MSIWTQSSKTIAPPTKVWICDFSRYTIVSETLRRDPDMAVIEWLARNDEQIALPSVTLAELAYGIAKIRPDQRADRLEAGLLEWRQRFSGRIFALTEDAAIA